MQQYYEIPTPQGVMRGFFHTPQQEEFPVCIIFHGFTGCNTGTKFSYTQLSRMLEKEGIATIRMDFLGSGESDLSFRDMTFEDELNCACLILEEILKIPATQKIYLLGHSMGGVIASELAKLYPDKITKMCLWSPAFNLSEAIDYLKGCTPLAEFYDHNGFEISHRFVEDIISRDFYKDLGTYQNQLMIIHGTKDTTVPFKISKKYLSLFHQPQFYPIKDATHNFGQLEHIQTVIQLTYDYLRDEL